MSARLERWLAPAVLLLILLFAAGTRLYKLDEKSLWSDELATIATSRGNSIDPAAYRLRHESFDPPAPVAAKRYVEKVAASHGTGNFAQTAEVLKANVHPPFFFWLMNRWLHAFSMTPDTLRLPAVLFGIASVLVMYVTALAVIRLNPDTSNKKAQAFALLATAMLAFSAYQVDHAQDARQYTLLLLLALIIVRLCVYVLHQPTRWAGFLGLGMLLALGGYTQYFFITFTGFVFLYLIGQRYTDKPFLLKLAASAAIMLVLFLPWLPYFQAQMAFLKQAGHYTAGLWNPVQLPEKLWRILCEFCLPDFKLGKAVPLVILLSALGMGFINKKSASPRWKPSPALALILFWLGSVIGGQIVLDIVKDSHTATIRRYLFLASPAFYLLLAYALMMLGEWKHNAARLIQPVLAAALLIPMAGDTLYFLTRDHQSSDEFRQAAHKINNHYQSGDRVLVTKSGAMAVGMAYYLQPDTPMLGIDVPEYKVLEDGSPLMTRLEKVADNSKRIWLVYSHAAPSTERRLKAWLMAKGFREADFEKFPGVKVALLRK